MADDKLSHYEKLIMDIVKDKLKKSQNQSVAHRWDHIYRVYKRSIAIAELIKDENIDMELLKISALLHDIDQNYNNKRNHVVKSIEKSNQILKNINYPENKTKKILDIIAEHSTEDNSIPSSIEAKILFDADKLDGIGAIGIARVFAFCGQNNLTPKQAIIWYKKKINIALKSVQTEIGKEKLKNNLKYVNDFFDKFNYEEINVI